MRNNETESVRTAVAKVVRFANGIDSSDATKLTSSYADLYDFVRIVGENAKQDETKRRAEDLMSFIKNKLVIRSIGINTPRKYRLDALEYDDYTKVGGISINMTWKIKTLSAVSFSILWNVCEFNTKHENKYSDLGLAKASRWEEFVNWIDEVCAPK